MIKFKVWWKPQIPMKSFEVEVSSREEGFKLCDVLAKYDIFQYENKVKPDYCNVGGVVFLAKPISENDDDWIDVPNDDDEWKDYVNEIEDYERTSV